MPDRFRRVIAGDPLTIPAPVWNEVLDALQWIRGQRNIGGPSMGMPLKPGMIFVRNDSGADRAAFEVLGISGTIILPTDNADQFKFNPMLKGVVPTTASHTGKFVVCAEPIASGALGRAWAFGVFPCQINVRSTADRTADVKDSDPASLNSGAGAAQILWADSGTGVKWALVHLANTLAGTLASPATLGSNTEGSETAATDTWTRDAITSGTAYGGVPLDLWTVSRMVYNHAGDKKLYAYLRKLSFDSFGLLRVVSAETRVEIDAAEAC